MASENFKKAVLQYGKAFIEEITKQLLLNNKKATGELIDSLDYKIVETANEITLEILANDYLKFVDGGRKAGTLPNIKNIKKWAEVKGIRSKGNRILTSQQIGFAIAKSIERNGIKPSNILKKAKATFLSNKANLEKKVIDGATLDVKKLIKDAIKNLNK